MYEATLNKLSFHSQANSTTGNTNRLQFFSSLFEVNDVVFLDPSKHYCILKTDKYNNIRQELDSSYTNQQKLEKMLFEVQLESAARGKEAALWRQELDETNHNQLALKTEYEALVQRCRDYERNEAQLRQMAKQNRLQSDSMEGKQPKKKAPTKNYTTNCCQTEVQLELQEQASHQQAPEEVPQPQVEAAEQRLYQLLQGQMEKFQQQFQAKVAALEEQRLSIDKWAEENTLLRQENAQLKQQIVERNIEEEKLQAWRESVAGFVAKIESSIVKPSVQIEAEEGEGFGEMGRLRGEILELRGRIVEMRGKMRRIDELMEGEGEVGDEGAIGVLVRLSQKVKGIVKSMVMEVQQLW